MVYGHRKTTMLVAGLPWSRQWRLVRSLRHQVHAVRASRRQHRHYEQSLQPQAGGRHERGFFRSITCWCRERRDGRDRFAVALGPASHKLLRHLPLLTLLHQIASSDMKFRQASSSCTELLHIWSLHQTSLRSPSDAPSLSGAGTFWENESRSCSFAGQYGRMSSFPSGATSSCAPARLLAE